MGQGLEANEGNGLLRSTSSQAFEQEHELKVEDGPSKPAAPWWTWLLLTAAVLAVSSAGVVFALLADVPPLTLAAWRLQLTSVLLGIGAAAQAVRMPAEDRRRTLRSGGLLAASGGCLAVHFGAWVYSTQATSLAHSLLFVSATPLLLAAGTWALRRPISRGELWGTAVGVVGAVLLAAAAGSDAQVTLRGDMAALGASFAFIGYLLIGRRLRAWMPAFVYAFAVTGLAAALLSLGGAAFEGARLQAAGRGGVFGWAADRHYLPLVLYLAVVPGIVGHTGFNTLLRYLPPLVISLACNLEPLLGSLLGWAAGVVAPPGAATYCGGTLVLASTAAVSLASHRRERGQASRAAASAALNRILSSGSDEGDAEGEAAAPGLRIHPPVAADVDGWGAAWTPQQHDGGAGLHARQASHDADRPPSTGVP